MQRKKFLYILLFLILTLFYKAKADNTFQVSYSTFDYFDGGCLVLTGGGKSGELPVSFFIKPNWPGESEVIYSWRGIKRNDARGSISGVKIIAEYPLEASMLVVWEDNSRPFVAFIDSSTNVKALAELKGCSKDNVLLKAEWLGRCGNDEFLLLVNDCLFNCSILTEKKLSVNLIESGVLSAILLNPDNDKLNYRYAYLTGEEGWNIICFGSNSIGKQQAARILLPGEYRMKSFGNQVGLISSTKNSGITLLQIIDKDKGMTRSSWIESSFERICVTGNGNDIKVYFLQSFENEYYLYISGFNDLKDKSKWIEAGLPDGFIEPYGIWQIGDVLYIIFRNGLVTADMVGGILSADFLPIGEYFREIPKPNKFDNYLILSSSTSSLVLSKNEHEFWFINLFLKNTGKIVIPLILGIFMIIFLQMYRHQKRFLNAVLDLPSSGIVFIISKSGSLLRANDSGKIFLGITDKVPLKHIFQYYCMLEHTKPINELVNRALILKDTIVQKINIIQNNESKEWYCTIMPLKNFTGMYKGLVLTAIDITEELEKKRLSNWAQLAHDMQTNLTTIRLNAEQLEVEHDPANIERRKKVIHQVGLLIQRVRDIVTVGRSDTIERQVVNAAAICLEARIEFDESMFPDVDFELKVLNFNVSCDKMKMVRALRNAIENGIRSLSGQPGIVKISCWPEGHYAYFSVADSGEGMDEETKKKILTPYFTTSKGYGGTGIGTMIIQHVVQLHGGELTINSEKGSGTEVIFCIPNYAHLRISK